MYLSHNAFTMVCFPLRVFRSDPQRFSFALNIPIYEGVQDRRC